VGKYEGYVVGEWRIRCLFWGDRRQDLRRVGIQRFRLGRHSHFSGRMCEHQGSLGDVCGNAKVSVKSTWFVTEQCGRRLETKSGGYSDTLHS